MGGALSAHTFARVAQSRRRSALPFLAAAVIGGLSLASPPTTLSRPVCALVGGAVFLLVVCLVGARTVEVPDQRWSATIAPYGFFLVVASWRDAAGSAHSLLTPLVALPVVWLSLYGSRRQMWLSVLGATLVLSLPILFVGAPDYPATEWLRVLLWTVLAALIGPTVQTLVDAHRVSLARVVELAPARAHLDSLLAAATDHSIVSTDVDGLITYFSPGSERLLGWSSADVVGTHSPELFHDAAEVATRAAEFGVAPGFEVFRHAAVHQRGTQDWTYVTRSGRQRIVSLAFSEMHAPDGRLIGYSGIATDVTDSRAAANALSAEREIYRLLVEHLPNTTVALFDDRLHWAKVGGAWPASTGQGADVLIGRHFTDFADEAEAAQLDVVLSGGLAEPTRGELVTRSDRIMEVDAVPVDGGDGRRYVLAVARDVSAARAAARAHDDMVAALAISEQSFRTAFDSAPTGIAIVSAERGHDGKLLRANTVFAEMLGFNSEELSGRRLDELVHADDRPLVHPASDGPGDLRVQRRFVHTSGRTLWVDLFWSLVRDAEGQPSYFITHADDVTTRKESERALLDALNHQRAAAAALREIDEMRTEVVSTISHELRTPLTSITGYLEMLGDGDAGTLSTEQQRMVAIAGRNAHRLRTLVDDLLVLSRLDTFTDGAATEPVDVHAVVQRALETARPAFARRGQQVTVRAAGGTPLVTGDAEHLDRAIGNLLSNAAKYSPDGGRVDVSVALRDREVDVVVADSGIGIPVPDQERLFERFFRASNVLERAIDGTGLGLAIVASIVERHGGRVVVESEPGAGARFTMTLPLASRATVPLLRTG